MKIMERMRIFGLGSRAQGPRRIVIWTMASLVIGAVALAAQGRGAAGGGAQGAPTVGPRPGVGPADRPAVDPAAVERGRRVWAAECITCHGGTARGSDTVPSLLRSL